MKAVAFSLLAVAATISADFADTSKRDAFEGCLSAGIAKFKNLCEPADLLARAIVFECNPQLTDLVISMPLGLSTDRLQHPCR